MQTPLRSAHAHVQTGLDLERIRFLTRNFRLLQGLQLKVPLGLYLMVWGAANLMGINATPFLALPWVLIRPATTAAYYRRRLGEVEQPGRRFRTFTLPWARIAAGVFVCGNLVWCLAPPFNARPVYVFCGVLLIWLWFETGHSPYLYYYPLLGSLILAVGAPNATFGYLLPVMGRFGTAAIFTGAVIVLVGSLDHRQLVVGMPQLLHAGEDDEATAEARR